MRDSEFFYEMGQECTTHQHTLQDDGSMSLYFRAWTFMTGYTGIDGRLFNCGEAENTTCLGAMKYDEAEPKSVDDMFSYNVLWINDEHDLAVNYMCSEMMMGLFSFQWWSVYSKNQAVDADTMQAAANKVIDANVGYTDLGSRITEQGSTCEYDWTLA